ncbi:MAG TPA: hypothetical protein VM940_01285 [Chthoniobacterales bacterium]|nr:hypothetical protein [Chthoniobacterales bacterium]
MSAPRERVAPGNQEVSARHPPDLWRIGLFLVACLPIFFILRLQLKYWVNIPIWDEWDTPGRALLHFAQDKLSWSDLLAQHNESRKFFPRLIYLAMNVPLGWDVRYGMVLTFLGAGALSGFLLRHLRYFGEAVRGPALFAWLLINLLLFGPSQSENYLSGFTFEILIPVLALCGCLTINLSDRPLAAKCTWNSVLCIIATYSFAHGMLLWILAFPLPGASDTSHPFWRRRWIRWLACHGLIGAIAVGCYFIGYRRPEIAPPPASLLDLPLIGNFILIWLGAVLKSGPVGAHFTGSLAAILLAAACALSAFGVWRNRPSWSRYYPWLLLACFAMGVALISAIGRANLGLEPLVYESSEGFGSYRYRISSVLAYLAMIGLFYHLYRDWIVLHPIWRFRFIIAITVLTTLLGVAEVFLFQGLSHRLNAFRENRRRARTAVIWSEALPRNPELFHAYPYVDQFPTTVAAMKRAGLIKAPEINDQLKAAVSVAPSETGDTAGRIEGSPVGDGKMLIVSGWALIPGRDARADYVVLGWQTRDGAFHPFTALPTGRRRPDMTGPASSAIRNSGFLQAVDISQLPKEPLTIRAWSVDLKDKQVFPINGTVRVDAPSQP